MERPQRAGSVAAEIPSKPAGPVADAVQEVQPVIRICIVDSHALVRGSIRRLFGQESGLAVVAECGSVGETLATLRTTPCDLVLLELDLGRECGASLLPELEAMNFSGRVLVLAGEVYDIDALRLLSQGVAGILLKENSPARLLKAVRHVMAGEFWFDPHYLQLFVRQAAHLLKKDQRQEFTVRECMLAQMLIEGLSNKEIAARLELSESAATAAIRRLFARTGARNRCQFVSSMLPDYRQGALRAFSQLKRDQSTPRRSRAAAGEKTCRLPA